jgi:hypothetical protein
MGRAEVNSAQTPGYLAEAELCRAAGADMGEMGRWIDFGRQRA